jgi:hypothetical protein
LGEAPLAFEKRTIRAMVRLYCRAHHHPAGADLCAACRELLDYALARLDRCPFGDEKPTCARCSIHCYRADMRARVKRVMRYAGPRMVFRHPILALCHQWQALRRRRTT